MEGSLKVAEWLFTGEEGKEGVGGLPSLLSPSHWSFLPSPSPSLISPFLLSFSTLPLSLFLLFKISLASMVQNPPERQGWDITVDLTQMAGCVS